MARQRMAGTRLSMGNRRRVRVTARSRLCPLPAKAGRDSDSEIVSTQYLRMKDANMYEALWAYCEWKHGKTNGRYSTVFPARELSPQRARAGHRQQSSKKSPRSQLGDPPPNPLGFNAFSPGFQGPREPLGNPTRSRRIPAPESALGSHPCVALSSAQVTMSLARISHRVCPR